MTRKSLAIALAAGAATMAIATASSAQITMSATYFTHGDDADFGTQCCGTYNNLIQGTLGPDGLPVANPGYGGPTIHDVNGAGEITWWTPSANNIQTPGTHTITLPFADGSFFPPDGSGGGDGNGFLTAVFTGVLHVPTMEQVTFTFGADDDAYIALDNTVVTQLGGVHGDTPGPATTSVLNPGDYTLRLFYADRYPTQAALNFSLDTQDVTITAPPGVPEPMAWSLMIMGFGLAGAALRRRRGDVVA